LGLDRVKHVIIVDEDIDVYDMEELFYAISTRVDARKSVQIVTTMTHPNDPCAKESLLGRPLTVGGLIIDATTPYEDFPETGISPPERREKVAKQVEKLLGQYRASSKFSW